MGYDSTDFILGDMKMWVKIAFLLSLLMGLGGCAALGGDPVDRADRAAKALAPREPKTLFDEVQAKGALGRGNVEIRSVLVSCYGRGIACMQGSAPMSGMHVYLYPYTSYLHEVLAMEKQLKADVKRHSDYKAVKLVIDPKFTQFRLTAKTDEFGRYQFKNVKPGKYYVLSQNATGHRTIVGHFYDEFGFDHPRQVDSPAVLEFNEVLDIAQSTGEYKFESTMSILQINGLR